MSPHELALETPVFVAPHNRVPAVHAPGLATPGCQKRKCHGPHTSDWRAPKGSAANRHGVEASLVQTSLRDALATAYRSEAHLTGYVLLEHGTTPLRTQPRIAKDALPWLRSEGYEVVVTCFMADWDTPGHVPWTPDERAKLDALWASAEGPLATCGLYLSPKGARLVQPLTAPMTAERGEASLRAWLEQLVAVGVDPGVRAVKDWTRLMRTPRHRRAAGEHVREGLLDLSRMVPVDAPAPFVEPEPVAAPKRVRRAPADNVVPLPTEDVPAGWARVADAVGAAIRDTVHEGWRRCYLALAGALCSRGCPLEAVAAVVVRAHLVDAGWESFTDDRRTIAQSTVARWSMGQDVTGYSTLRSEFPSVADALDGATVSGVEASVLRQLAVPAPAPVPVEDAVATLRRELRDARGVVLVAAPPGTGKTHAVAEHARELPPIEGRARPGQRIAVSAPTHKLAQQTAAKVRSLRLFSPPSHVGLDGKPTCVYAESARAIAAGGQSVTREFCLGRKKNPCELAETCPARAGMEGDERANLVVGPHGLVGALLEYAGTAGTLVIDEPGEVLAVERITLDDLDTAVRYLDAFVPTYASAMTPALLAWAAWVRELGPVEGAPVSLPDAVRAGASTVSDEDLGNAGIDPLTPAEQIGELVVLAARTAIADDASSKAPPLTTRTVMIARAQVARALEVGRASRVLHLLRKGLLSDPAHAARIDTQGGDRAATVVGPNEDLLDALNHAGPVVVLDANAELHVPAIARVLGAEPRLVKLSVRDGAPIRRTVFATKGATRGAWMPRGVPDWGAILPYLRRALEWLAEDRATQRVALLCWKEMRVALEATLRPDATETAALVKEARVSRKALERAVAEIRPVLETWPGELLTGHFGGLEGLDHLAGCDATITLGDPRPNLGAEVDKAAYLGLDPQGRLDGLAAAELQQAHGRLRTVHRTRPGRQLHVGSVLPAGWEGLEVDVRAIPTGRPKTVAAMDGSALAGLREASGMGLRAFAKALGVTHPTVLRYESGERPIPADIARAASALVASGTETPVQRYLDRGFGTTIRQPGCPSRGATATGVSVPVGATGVSVPPDARRLRNDEPTDAERAEMAAWVPGESPSLRPPSGTAAPGGGSSTGRAA